MNRRKEANRRKGSLVGVRNARFVQLEVLLLTRSRRWACRGEVAGNKHSTNAGIKEGTPSQAAPSTWYGGWSTNAALACWWDNQVPPAASSTNTLRKRRVKQAHLLLPSTSSGPPTTVGVSACCPVTRACSFNCPNCSSPTRLLFACTPCHHVATTTVECSFV